MKKKGVARTIIRVAGRASAAATSSFFSLTRVAGQKGRGEAAGSHCRLSTVGEEVSPKVSEKILIRRLIYTNPYQTFVTSCHTKCDRGGPGLYQWLELKS
jgi:hypothetical protein